MLQSFLHLGSKAVHKPDAPVLCLQERVVTFVLRQDEGSETISKAALLQFLQHEYEVSLLLVCWQWLINDDINPFTVMLYVLLLHLFVLSCSPHCLISAEC